MWRLEPTDGQQVCIRDRVATSAVKSILVDNTRQAFAHDAIVAMRDGASPNALGGAITKALCGAWDHSPPCPLAPHYVSNVTEGETVSLRVVFATEPSNERRVRDLIGEALAGGQLIVPDGGIAYWELQSASPGRLRDDEEALAADLIAH